ncbi:MAG: retropepsin-like aspartic protease [Methanosarcinales archaeon]
MAIIEKAVKLVGSKGRDEVTGLFDISATYSCIKRTLAEKLGLIDILPEPIEFETAKEDEKVEVKEHMSLMFYIDGYRFSDEFFVLPDLSEKLIIGTTTMQKWRFKLDFEKEDVIIDPRVTKLRLLRVVRAGMNNELMHS